MPPDEFDSEGDGADAEADGEWGTSGWDDEPEPEPEPSSEPSDPKPPKGPDEQYCSSCGAVIKKEAEICPECGVSTGRSAGGPQQPKTRLASALIGAIVGFITSWFLTPLFGQPIGGLVAGYLRGPNTRESTITGALSGIIAAIPFLLVIGFFFVIFGIGGAAEGAAAFGGVVVFAIIVLVLAVGFYAGLGALGGLLGAELSDREEPEL